MSVLESACTRAFGSVRLSNGHGWEPLGCAGAIDDGLDEVRFRVRVRMTPDPPREESLLEAAVGVADLGVVAQP